MGLVILKFILLSTVFGGIIKTYFDYPFIQNNPKLTGALLILAVLFAIWIIPRSLGFIFKLLLVLICLILIGYGVFVFLGWGQNWLTTLSSSQKTKEDSLQVVTNDDIAQMEAFSKENVVVGVVDRVYSGYFFQVGSSMIKLYGIDAPDPVQMCQDKRGYSYACGEMAKATLERIVLNKLVHCVPVGYGDGDGNFVATCVIEPNIDLGVALVGSGWAVADRAQSLVYIPYEKEAHQMKRGLWEGKFVAPWEARKQKNVSPHP